MTSDTRFWSCLDDLAGRPAGSDEFAPDVAAAIAELRAAQGLDREDAVDAPTLDRWRAELQALLPGVNRRSFLRLSGAAAVLAAISGCGGDPHPDTLVPLAAQPEGTTLGEALHYATVVRCNGAPCPVVARCYDGRPIKLDGNPDHPLIRGRSDARVQAAVLDLYDPDRGGLDPAAPRQYRDGPRQRSGGQWQPTGWGELDRAVGERLREARRILWISGPLDGPAQRAFVELLQRALGERLRHIAYHPWAEDSAVEARARVLGERSAPRWHLERAAVLVTFASDPLAHGDVALQAAYGRFRRGQRGEPGQLIAVEPVLTQTGSCADVRVRAAMADLAWVAWAVAGEIAAAEGAALPPAIAAALPEQRARLAAALRPVAQDGESVPAVRYIAERLLAARRRGALALALASGPTHSGPESLDLHIAVCWLNRLLGAEGRAVSGAPPRATRDGLSAALAEDWDLVLVSHGANPAFDLPGAAERLRAVPCLVSLNPTRDETAALAHWQAPGLHDLESWGDAELAPGQAEIQQPVIQPLWDTRAAEESLASFLSAAGLMPPELASERAAVPAQPPLSVVSRKQLWQASARGLLPWRSFVRRVWSELLAAQGQGGEAAWRALLQRGFLAVPPRAAPPALPHAIAAPPAPASASALTLVCSGSRTVGDGSQLNNPWLQELPDPVSKVCWDGWAALSPADAARLGVADDEVIELAVGEARVRLPALVQDGQHPGCVEVFLGWGRSAAGLVADITAADGWRANAYLLAGGQRWGAAVTVQRTGLRYELARTQHHHRLAGERVARDDVWELHQRDPGQQRRQPAHHAWERGTDGRPGGRLSIWGRHHTYPGHRWGMVIDLDLCTGCGACIVACSAENNVPAVGRDEVRRNRELHWIRIDRYYSAPAAEAAARLDVAVLHQPMLCQQCDHAPCEAVCPANATMKSEEGINIQVYNRCIGTRYCANNCPYKVRRFNWYQYSAMRAGPQRAGEPAQRIARNLLGEGSAIAAAERAHAPLHFVLNPEVTVRHRGVMEKCNFCLQRQRAWRREEVRRHQRLPDGFLTTACAQACPTEAIVWGDLNDPEARVSALGEDPRAYRALDAESNTRPKIAYLAKLRHRPASAEELAALRAALGPEAAR
ncbi:MAG: 4Fe-4S dicluster domain-containing protein [Planctomycetota bacterium]|nr:4Fe-4S dicluster domain-containing protein [Planctomycetota bacterium]MCX8039879.1 4Fe-4S dicluster domain-containing protein [Planctomycetota bacterium]MDW8372162.1 4Fe-4S dicluster domain-containing protein [Planctomycetota bacterium]